MTDAEIRTAMRLLFERVKVVAKPSGATAVAAVLAGKIDVRGQSVGIIISGGNIDVQRFNEVASEASMS